MVSFEHFPAESSPDVTNERSTTSTPLTEDRNHAIAFAAATAAAAEAAVAAAQAAARVVRLAGYGRHSKEERAATLIQSYYRGYLVRPLTLCPSHANNSVIILMFLMELCNIRIHIGLNGLVRSINMPPTPKILLSHVLTMHEWHLQYYLIAFITLNFTFIIIALYIVILL